jgi:hypothetical protein
MPPKKTYGAPDWTIWNATRFSLAPDEQSESSPAHSSSPVSFGTDAACCRKAGRS